MAQTVLLSPADDAASAWLSELRAELEAASVRVVVAVRGPDSGRTRTLGIPSHESVVIEPPRLSLRSRLLGQLERAVVLVKALVAGRATRGAGGLAPRLAGRLQLERRLAGIRAQRLEAAASAHVEAVFDALDPDLLVSFRAHEPGELPVLAAAQTRRTPVVAVVRDETALSALPMPAARLVRLLVPSARLAEVAVRHGAHPAEVEVVDPSNGASLAGAVLGDVGLGSRRRSARRSDRTTRARVLMVGNEQLPIPPSKGGAVELYVDEVSRRLADEFDVVTCSPGPIDESEPALGRRVLDPGKGYLPSLIRLLERERYDIVHVFNRPWFIPHVAAAAGDARLLLNLHNDHLGLMGQEENGAIVDKLDSVVTDGEFLRRRTLDRAPNAAGKVASIRSGVDVAAFDPGLRGSVDVGALHAEFDLEDGPLLVSIGRLSPEKGTHLLPAILASVQEREPRAQVLVVGSPWFGETISDEYARRVRREAQVVGNAIRFTGFLPYRDIPRVLAAADVLVAPGQWEEPFGRFVIEAMAAGVPLVTSPLGGVTEAAVHGRTALLVSDFRRPRGYADAVLRILADHELRARIVGHGRRLVERHFTWERTASGFRRLYETVLARPRLAR